MREKKLSHVPVMYARTRERSCDQGSSGEPREPRAAVGGRVEPGREHGEQRERPVEVVEPLGGAPVVGEEQQAEPDLRDEQRLGEREQVRDDAARLAPPVVREPASAAAPQVAASDQECSRCDGPLASAAERYREDRT